MIGDFLALAAIAGGTGGVILRSWYASTQARIHRRLARLPRTDLRDVQENTLVRVVGKVKPLEGVIASPIHGWPCVYYKVFVEVKRGVWIPRIDEQHGMPFLLEDATGYVIVDPLAADITTRDVRFLPALVPDRILDPYLMQHQIYDKRNVRLLERRIMVGQEICVMGTAIGERDTLAAPPDGYRSERGSLLRFSGSKRYPLVISDTFRT